MDINIKLSNYKLFENKELSVADAKMLIISGPNEIGKTSIITAIEEAWSLKGFTPVPLKEGAEQGYKAITGQDIDGNPITIVHNFSKMDQKGSFYAIDNQGKTIKSVGKIRELLGVFKPVSLEEIYFLVSTPDGRRKFIKEYIYPILEEEKITQINALTAEVNEKTGKVFLERRDVNAQLKAETNILNSIAFTKEEEHILEVGASFNESISKLKEELELEKALLHKCDLVDEKANQLRSEAKTMADSLKENEERIEALEQELETLRNKNANLLQKIAQKKDEFDALQDTSHTRSVATKKIEEYKDTIAEGEAANETYRMLSAKKESLKDATKRVDSLNAKAIMLSEEIEGKRQQIKDILSGSSLPSGLEIEEDNIRINGFDFDQTQVSESTAKLALAELLCKLYTARFITMGNLGAFGKERLSELFRIAQEHDKIVILEQVDDSTDDIRIIANIEE
jgi:uncharacterized coiled-coil DUF342 family protein